jgi:hypothetical protein
MTDVVKRCRKLIGAWLVALSVLAPVTSSRVLAQKSKRQTPRASQAAKKQDEKSKAQTPAQTSKEQIGALRDEFVRLTGEYKKDLENLKPFLENGVKKAEGDLAKSRELYALGLVAKKKIDDDEHALAEAQTKLADNGQKMKAADAQMADALVEEKVVEQAAQLPAPPKGKMLRTTAYIRYTGSGSWSLASGAGRVMGFYQQTFGRQLPVSAFGQTGVHNQLGFDHRNAMDVALSPASREGQALIAYLQANGIPFFAFYMAIPGSATGAHIHVGMPSHRISQPLSTH